MGKRHVKHGFEYECDKYCFSGDWVVQWNFRPEGDAIFLHYASPEGKTLKKDIEAFLSTADVAKEYYYSKLARVSDVTAAEQALKEAQGAFAHVSSPDFDLRSNNPNKEARRCRDVKGRLTIAEIALNTAIYYRGLLDKKE